MSALPSDSEWLETDGFGGYSMGHSALVPSRRYHSLLTVALTPPTQRIKLLSAFESYCHTPDGIFPLSTFRYPNQVLYPKGHLFLSSCELVPWTIYRFTPKEGLEIELSVVFHKASQLLIVRWSLKTSPYPSGSCSVKIRPLLSATEHHELQKASTDKEWKSVQAPLEVAWTLPSYPSLHCAFIGQYESAPQWHYQLILEEERKRGYNYQEDLFSPGILSGILEPTFTLCLSSSIHRDRAECSPKLENSTFESTCSQLFEEEKEKRSSLFAFSASAFIVARDNNKETSTIIAGYPWFSDWGRDTCIAVRGLCIAYKNYSQAHSVLKTWGNTLSDGMIPNVFPDSNAPTLYNSVDASLWYCVAVGELLERDTSITENQKNWYVDIVGNIINSYRKGTRFKIHMTSDGLLMHGITGTQLTWMDAKYGETVFTPRIGKAVEVQCLWLNVLKMFEEYFPEIQELYSKGHKSFVERFWDPGLGYLRDVVDTPIHMPGDENALRPNQILAVGGLPFNLLPPDLAKSVVDTVERTLVTPSGVRSLTPFSLLYRGFYEGPQFERDSSYHQGTGWLWLLGPFIEAWVRVNSDAKQVHDQAFEKFLRPLFEFAQRNRGFLPELCDGTCPHTFRGAPFQAWSLGELIRVAKDVLHRDDL